LAAVEAAITTLVDGLNGNIYGADHAHLRTGVQIDGIPDLTGNSDSATLGSSYDLALGTLSDAVTPAWYSPATTNHWLRGAGANATGAHTIYVTIEASSSATTENIVSWKDNAGGTQWVSIRAQQTTLTWQSDVAIYTRTIGAGLRLLRLEMDPAAGTVSVWDRDILLGVSTGYTAARNIYDVIMIASNSGGGSCMLNGRVGTLIYIPTLVSPVQNSLIVEYLMIKYPAV
jgi:hypothetical protein